MFTLENNIIIGDRPSPTTIEINYVKVQPVF